jgi:hypothetical protein
MMSPLFDQYRRLIQSSAKSSDPSSCKGMNPVYSFEGYTGKRTLRYVIARRLISAIPDITGEAQWQVCTRRAEVAWHEHSDRQSEGTGHHSRPGVEFRA